jgi:superfamily II DNA or RNA helicase
MAKSAVITQSNPFIAISADGQNPLPPEVYRDLAYPLTYEFTKSLYGEEAMIACGASYGMVHETRRLYVFDEAGRFVCQKGWLPRLREMLQVQGYDISYINKTPPTNPVAYDADWDHVFERIQPRPLQDVCLAQIAMHDQGVIDAVTAFGKMYIIAMTCLLYPKARIDIITARKDVVSSIVRLLTRYIADIGQIGGGKRRKRQRTVFTLDSVHHSDYDADIVLVDEVHEAMSDRRAETLSHYYNARMYGFTATKETRADNAHVRMEGLFGPTIFQLDYPRAEELGLVVPIVVQWCDVRQDYNPCAKVKTPVMRNRLGIWTNDVRNQVIANAVQSIADDGLQTLVLVDTVEHALHLRRLLPDFELCYSEEALSEETKRNRFDGDGLLRADDGMTWEKRNNMRKAFESRRLMKAIATGVWSVGVSFDSLQVLAIATGSGSETAATQAPGRVCRIDDPSGKQVGVVLDFFSHFDAALADRDAGRRRIYARHGWTQYNGDGSLWVTHAQRGKRGTIERPSKA